MKHSLNTENQRHRRGIFVVVAFENSQLRRSGIVGKYVAPTELADFFRAVLQKCRAYGAGKRRHATMAKVPLLARAVLVLMGFNICKTWLFQTHEFDFIKPERSSFCKRNNQIAVTPFGYNQRF
jgi:hypothetical protein